MEPLRDFQLRGGVLPLGYLLSLYPPVCVATTHTTPKVQPRPMAERLRWLADFYQQIKDLPNGQQIHLKSGQD